MRSIMALSWSLANFVAGASLTAAAEVAIGYSWMNLRSGWRKRRTLHHARILEMTLKSGAHSVKATSLLIHSAPTGERGDAVSLCHSGAMQRIEPGISRFRVWCWRTIPE